MSKTDSPAGLTVTGRHCEVLSISVHDDHAIAIRPTMGDEPAHHIKLALKPDNRRSAQRDDSSDPTHMLTAPYLIVVALTVFHLINHMPYSLFDLYIKYIPVKFFLRIHFCVNLKFIQFPLLLPKHHDLSC